MIPESQEIERFRILIANDEEMQLEMLSFKFLNTNKCVVDTAING